LRMADCSAAGAAETVVMSMLRLIDKCVPKRRSGVMR
jgi:hypothetical protein